MDNRHWDVDVFGKKKFNDIIFSRKGMFANLPEEAAKLAMDDCDPSQISKIIVSPTAKEVYYYEVYDHSGDFDLYLTPEGTFSASPSCCNKCNKYCQERWFCDNCEVYLCKECYGSGTQAHEFACEQCPWG